MTDLDILYPHPGSKGWAPVTALAKLAADQLGGELVELNGAEWKTSMFKARALLPRVKGGGRRALLIAPYPAHLQNILELEVIAKRYDEISAWVFDSFWTDRVPMVARRGRRFDHLYVTNPEDIEPWSKLVSWNVDCLPWGSDVFGNYPVNNRKMVDLLRVGRQPYSWDDDKSTLEVAARFNVKFEGRPPFGHDDDSSHDLLRRRMNESKLVLAFSNSVDRAYYTHQEREYLTGRWTDALASGCLVVGRLPKCEATKMLLRDASTYEISSNLTLGIKQVREIVHDWKPEVAQENQMLALKFLDWRHRLAVIAKDLHIDPPKLKADLCAIDGYLRGARRSSY
ncbi:glycosyltransferase family 1 protein [Neomicrococcus lactis]|uniref:glycosyltransferase family 1 protein n=1 Tax=Neomicrococcus lactis TaxID=732241 RepID=UPI002301DE57|nr:glycosyltransferase family 1 protein [Neomicrococcus lactis]